MVAVSGAGSRDEVLWEIHRDRILNDRERRQTGTYSGALKSAAAVALDRTPRTIHRWLEVERTLRRRFELTSVCLGYIRLHDGNLRAASDDLKKRGEISVSYQTFRRAVKRLPPGVRVGITLGPDAMANALPYVTLAPPNYSNEVFEIDNAFLGRLVVWDEVNRQRAHPWLTIVIDVFARVFVGFSVTAAADRGNPTAESAFHAVANTLDGRDYGDAFVGGLPGWFRYDQEQAFMYPVADAIHRLGGKTQPVTAKTPQAKPYVERAIRTFKVRIAPQLPGYGERLGMNDKKARPESKLLTLSGLANVLDHHLREQNLRFHKGINGVPLERYLAHLMPPDPVRVEERHMATALLRRGETRVVLKRGVTFNNIVYQGEATFAHIGEEVGIGWRNTHPEELHIFGADDRWLGKLTPAADAGEELRVAAVASRRHQIAVVARANRNAEKLRDKWLDVPGSVADGSGGTSEPDEPTADHATASELADLDRREAWITKNTKICR